jgi:hypothetical protein
MSRRPALLPMLSFVCPHWRSADLADPMNAPTDLVEPPVKLVETGIKVERDRLDRRFRACVPHASFAWALRADRKRDVTHGVDVLAFG